MSACKRAPRPAAPPIPAATDKSFEGQVLVLTRRLRERARQLTRSGPDAEDLVQETLLRAWKAWGKYEVLNVWAWLWLIMRNAFLDRRREAGKWREATNAHASDIADVRARAPRPPDEQVTSGLDDEQLRALGRLTAAQRSVVELQLEGVDDASIARQLRKKLITVRVFSCKARKHLREML